MGSPSVGDVMGALAANLSLIVESYNMCFIVSKSNRFNQRSILVPSSCHNRPSMSFPTCASAQAPSSCHCQAVLSCTARSHLRRTTPCSEMSTRWGLGCLPWKRTCPWSWDSLSWARRESCHQTIRLFLAPCGHQTLQWINGSWIWLPKPKCNWILYLHSS